MPRADFPSRRSAAVTSRLVGAAALGFALLAGGARGQEAPAQEARMQEARVGIPAGLLSLDPHATTAPDHVAAMRNMFDALVRRAPNQAIEPNLAESWHRIDDTTWEFRLRRGVRWHDGSPFTATDVQHSIERIPTLPNGAGGLVDHVATITVVVVMDEHTVRLRTLGPAPTLPAELDRVFIVQSRPNATLRAGDSAVGTGPYRYVSWSPGRELVLERWDNHWGDAKPHFERVTFQEIADGAARIAALRAGEVDLISEVPAAGVPALQRQAGLRVVQTPSINVVLLHPDGRETSPAVTDRDGRPLPRNPFRDLRVRQALSLALDRAALARGPMQGLAQPAAAPVPAGFFGVPRDLPPRRHDPAEARRLLAQAGYPAGFRVRLHCTDGRFDGDARLCAAVAAALAPIGIVAEPVPMPPVDYFTDFTRGDQSLSLNAWGTPAGDATYMLAGLLHSRGGDPSLGSFNRMRYVNRDLDRLTVQSLDVLNEAERRGLVERAVRIAVEDLAVIPVLGLDAVWAMNATRLSYTPRMDEETLAVALRPPAPR